MSVSRALRILVPMALSVFFSCARTVTIGVAFDLSGPTAEVGVNARDAVIMAAEEINASGGIAGRKLLLAIRDDRGDPELAVAMDRALAEEGAAAIVGHYTSGVTAAAIPVADGTGTVLISGTAASAEFSGKKDRFFRTMPDTAAFGKALGYHLRSVGVRDLVALYDVSNKGYALSLAAAVESILVQAGGSLSLRPWDVEFVSHTQAMAGIEPAVKDLWIIASGPDTGIFAQAARYTGQAARLWGSPWAGSPSLIQKGGAAVEGLVLPYSHDPGGSGAAMKAFTERFKARFHREPSLGIHNSYEALSALAEGLRRTGGKKEGLAEALASIEEFEGVQGNFRFDAWGDVQRDVYIIQVSDGAFLLLDTVSPEYLAGIE